LTTEPANQRWDYPDDIDDWAVNPVPMADRVILVAALVLSASVIVEAASVAADSRGLGVSLAIPAMLAVVAIFTGWEYAYAPAIGLCLLYGLLGIVSAGVLAYLPLAGLLIARFVRAEHRRGETEPFSNGALGLMFLTTSPVGFYLLWIGEGLINQMPEGW
jgi:hypothetical protein